MQQGFSLSPITQLMLHYLLAYCTVIFFVCFDYGGTTSISSY